MWTDPCQGAHLKHRGARVTHLQHVLDVGDEEHVRVPAGCGQEAQHHIDDREGFADVIEGLQFPGDHADGGVGQGVLQWEGQGESSQGHSLPWHSSCTAGTPMSQIQG